MGVGIITIHKEGSGQEWDNTYGFSAGSGSGPLDQADLEALIATNPAAGFTSGNTEPADGSFAGASSIIAAILGFERMLHYHTVTLTHINVSDNTTPGAPTGPFWSQAINLACIRDAAAFVAEDAIAPLSLAFLVNRNTNLLSVKPGRLYYRACLLDADVKPGTRVGVTWATPTAAANAQTYVQTQFANAHLDDYVSSSGGPLPAIFLAIPHYSTVEGEEGVIVSGAAVSGFSANKPVSRQLTRGRRRRVAP